MGGNLDDEDKTSMDITDIDLHLLSPVLPDGALLNHNASVSTEEAEKAEGNTCITQTPIRPKEELRLFLKKTKRTRKAQYVAKFSNHQKSKSTDAAWMEKRREQNRRAARKMREKRKREEERNQKEFGQTMAKNRELQAEVKRLKMEHHVLSATLKAHLSAGCVRRVATTAQNRAVLLADELAAARQHVLQQTSSTDNIQHYQPYLPQHRLPVKQELLQPGDCLSVQQQQQQLDNCLPVQQQPQHHHHQPMFQHQVKQEQQQGDHFPVQQQQLDNCLPVQQQPQQQHHQPMFQHQVKQEQQQGDHFPVQQQQQKHDAFLAEQCYQHVQQQHHRHHQLLSEEPGYDGKYHGPSTFLLSTPEVPSVTPSPLISVRCSSPTFPLIEPPPFSPPPLTPPPAPPSDGQMMLGNEMYTRTSSSSQCDNRGLVGDDVLLADLTEDFPLSLSDDCLESILDVSLSDPQWLNFLDSL